MSKRYGGRRPPEAPQQRLTATPNEIMTRAPLLQSLSQMERGFEAEEGPRPARWFWYECPDLKPVLPNSVDLRGIQWGRLTVVGLLAHSRSSNAAWVCRCACGRFEVRTAKAIRLRVNPDEGCQQCDYVRHIRRRAYFDRHGRWPEDWHAEAANVAAEKRAAKLAASAPPPLDIGLRALAAKFARASR